LALATANGDESDPIVLAQYKEIVRTLEWEKESGRTLSFLQMFQVKGARKRTLLNMSGFL
jgi:hypothetical protein